MPYPLYIISGISGSGKTTVGKIVATKIQTDERRAVFVDEDSYYVEDTPLIQLSNGTRTANWDCIEAIDPKTIDEIKLFLEKSPVVLVGFALPRKFLTIPGVVHIHLVTAYNPEDLYIRCREARQQAKPSINQERDQLMVREVVIPFYHEVVRNSDISHLVDVFDQNGKRIPLDDIVQTCLNIIQDSTKPRLTYHKMDVSQPYFDLIKSGRKLVEGRKISPAWKKVRRGDMITMTCNGADSFNVIVTAISLYLPSIGDPLGAYLTCETLDRTLPGVFHMEEGRKIYLQWSTEEEIKKMGMMGIQVNILE